MIGLSVIAVMLGTTVSVLVSVVLTLSVHQTPLCAARLHQALRFSKLHQMYTLYRIETSTLCVYRWPQLNLSDVATIYPGRGISDAVIDFS